MVRSSAAGTVFVLIYRFRDLARAKSKALVSINSLLNRNIKSCNAKGYVTRDDSPRRFLAQHSVAMLEQCCNHLKQCRNNVATLCWAKNSRCESSHVTSRSN